MYIVLGSRNDEGQNSKHPEGDGLDPRHDTLSMIHYEKSKFFAIEVEVRASLTFTQIQAEQLE